MLALRREDLRIQRLLWGGWGSRGHISPALMRLSFRVPWNRQWFPR